MEASRIVYLHNLYTRSHIHQALYVFVFRIVSQSSVANAIQLQDDAAITGNDIGDMSRVPRLCGGVEITNVVLGERHHDLPFDCFGL